MAKGKHRSWPVPAKPQLKQSLEVCFTVMLRPVHREILVARAKDKGYFMEDPDEDHALKRMFTSEGIYGAMDKGVAGREDMTLGLEFSMSLTTKVEEFHREAMRQCGRCGQAFTKEKGVVRVYRHGQFHEDCRLNKNDRPIVEQGGQW